MGFSCGFYRAKKLRDSITPKQIHAISNYQGYKDNEWAKENSIRFAEMYPDSARELKEMSTDVVNSYLTEKDEIIKDYETWCSNGRYFNDDILSLLKIDWNEVGNSAALTQKDVILILDYINEVIKGYDFRPVKPLGYYIDYIEEDHTLISRQTYFKFDGLVVKDEAGNQREIENDPSWEVIDLLVSNSNYFDSDKYQTFVSLRDTMIKILATTDFNKEVVWYSWG